MTANRKKQEQQRKMQGRRKRQRTGVYPGRKNGRTAHGHRG